MSTNRRVLLKLSGEAFGGGSIGLDPKVVRNIAEQVATAVREGVQLRSSWAAATSSAALSLRERASSVREQTTWACSVP